MGSVGGQDREVVSQGRLSGSIVYRRSGQTGGEAERRQAKPGELSWSIGGKERGRSALEVVREDKRSERKGCFNLLLVEEPGEPHPLLLSPRQNIL